MKVECELPAFTFCHSVVLKQSDWDVAESVLNCEAFQMRKRAGNQKVLVNIVAFNIAAYRGISFTSWIVQSRGCKGVDEEDEAETSERKVAKKENRGPVGG